MFYHYKPGLKNNAQTLRKNMTKEERCLWYQFLKQLPITVKRQHPIGDYIVDFYIPCAKLVLEIDGSQHYTDLTESDKVRDEYLQSLGITVIRYPNNQVNTMFSAVCDDLYNRLVDYFKKEDFHK